MSLLGCVITRFVQPLPAPIVQVATVLAAKSRPGEVVVATGSVLLVALVPAAEAVTSPRLSWSIPADSRIPMLGYSPAGVNDHPTVLVPAAAVTMFLAL